MTGTREDAAGRRKPAINKHHRGAFWYKFRINANQSLQSPLNDQSLCRRRLLIQWSYLCLAPSLHPPPSLFSPCTGRYDRTTTSQYCAGRTPRLLAQLGFHKVEHSNQDFYKVVREKRQPKHDVLITNPPYSGDHKKRCLEYCRASGKPWFLLVPNYVATKDYYRLAVLGEAAGPGGEPFYVVPETKYSFDHPEGTGHTDSPFSGVWYVHCGSHTEAVFKGTFAEKRGGVSVLRSLDELGRTGTVSTERRLNPRQRKALKKKRSAAAAARLS